MLFRSNDTAYEMCVGDWSSDVCSSDLSMGFSRQEYWSRLPFPSPGDLPDPRIEPGSSALEADPIQTEL